MAEPLADYPLVDLIVLNWNRPQDTIECAESILRSDYTNYRITVVDNGSTDDSVLRVKERFGDAVCIVANEANLGFAEGNNRGVEHALAQGAEFTLLLNNDTTIAPGMLSEMVRVMRSDARIGIAGPVIYYSGQPDKVWFAGMRFRFGLYTVRKGLHLKLPLAPIEPVDFISGCGMMVRRQVWEDIGLFDSRFFMYYEDLDLCIRANKGGYRVVCAARANMWHALSASTGGPDSPLKQYYQVKSTLLFCHKHTRGLQWLINVSIRLGHAAFVAIRQLLRGQLRGEAIRLYLKGILEATRGRA
jgi:GT2 family glycosyltransferase